MKSASFHFILTPLSIAKKSRFNTHFLITPRHMTGWSAEKMAEKYSTLTIEDLRVTLTLYDLPESTLKEFFIKIVKPYFSGNLNEAFKSLIEKAIMEETIIAKAKSVKIKK